MNSIKPNSHVESIIKFLEGEVEFSDQVIQYLNDNRGTLCSFLTLCVGTRPSKELELKRIGFTEMEISFLTGLNWTSTRQKNLAELKLSDNIQEKVKDIFTSLDTAQVNQLSDRITVTLSQVKDANSFKVEDTIDAIFLIGLTLKDANDKLEKETILLTVGISPPQKPHDTPTCTCVHHSSSSDQSDMTIDYEGYQVQQDQLRDPNEIDKLVYEQFLEWNFERDYPVRILGHGITGCVTLGRVWSNESPNLKYAVAVQMGDLYSMPFLKSQLLNEVRVLSYANEMGLKCVPKLRWAGYYGFGAEFYVVCTDYIHGGYSKELYQLNESESKLLQNALTELQRASIRLGEISKHNVIFNQSECFFVDLSEATVLKRTTKPLEYNVGDVSVESSSSPNQSSVRSVQESPSRLSYQP